LNFWINGLEIKKIYPPIVLPTMRFGIAVSDRDDWTARAMLSSFHQAGVDAVFIDLSDLTASVGGDLRLACGGHDLMGMYGLVVRDMGRGGTPQDVAFRFEVLRSLGDLGLPVVNPPEAIAGAANKFSTSFALQRLGIPTPRTTVTSSLKEALMALEKYERGVSKPLFGYKGKGIEFITEEEGLRAVLRFQGIIYLQELVPMEEPRDIRAFVVGDDLMGAIYRVAQPGQWISNLARGGRAQPCAITEELRDLAVRASRALGAVYSGVDLLETTEGLKVIEVNGTPSGRGIFEAMEVDVTRAIASEVIRRVQGQRQPSRH
jgi:tetrahydromethanopterin:alpha-L-glutamate ligase